MHYYIKYNVYIEKLGYLAIDLIMLFFLVIHSNFPFIIGLAFHFWRTGLLVDFEVKNRSNNYFFVKSVFGHEIAN